MKFLKTIRLDASDANVFPRAAEAEEWAVTGTFAFAEGDVAALRGKESLAFKTGWLGIRSFGRATLVQVTTITEAEREAVVEALATHLMAEYGAPDAAAARGAAQDEVAYAAGLADHALGTLLAIEREAATDGIRERIRAIPRPEGGHARIWTIVDDES
ncbi:MAG: hypothetical protein EXQ86_01225 [Rhodospirillales bacterium]|nr:hypothetical protein [Rhodospirillales bacterium]